MIRELIDLQHRLQEAENLIQRLEDQIQHLIDRENKLRDPGDSIRATVAQQPSRTEARPQYSYGARYAATMHDSTMGMDMSAEPRDAAYCVGREATYGEYRRPI